MRIIILSVVLVCVSFFSWAEEALESITVTASRTPLKIHEAGSSIIIITREQILQRNAENLAMLLRNIPGMAVSQQGALGSLAQVRVRGAEANQVLVLIDGVEANDISQGSEFNFATMLTHQIERLEIVLGPQSALWGSDALSGVINVITRPPQDTDSTMDIALETGSFGSVIATASVSAGNKNNHVQLSMDRLSTDGSNIARQGSEEDGYSNTTFNLTGTFTPGSLLSINYNLRQSDITTEFDDIDFGTTGLPVDADFVTETEQLYGGVTAQLSNLDGDLDQIVSLARTDTDNVNRTASPTNSIFRGVKDQFRYQTNFYQGKKVFTGVLEYEVEDYRQRGAESFFGNPNRDLSTSTSSAAIEYRHDLDVLNLSLSARYDDNSDFESIYSWRATAVWHINSSMSIHSSVGEGVKNPTFTERFGFFDTFLGNPGLEPERSLSWETGFRKSFLDNRMNLSATWYQAILENEINGFVFNPDTGRFTAENTSEESNRQGAELQFSFDLSESITLLTAYSYLDATQSDSTGTPVTEVRRPKNSASISAEFSWPGININVSMNHTGKQEDDFFPPFPAPQERIELDGYTLVNLTASYRLSERMVLSARLENIFDENYEEVLGFSSPGFSAYGGIRYVFR